MLLALSSSCACVCLRASVYLSVRLPLPVLVVISTLALSGLSPNYLVIEFVILCFFVLMTATDANQTSAAAIGDPAPRGPTGAQRLTRPQDGRRRRRRKRRRKKGFIRLENCGINSGKSDWPHKAISLHRIWTLAGAKTQYPAINSLSIASNTISRD